MWKKSNKYAFAISIKKIAWTVALHCVQRYNTALNVAFSMGHPLTLENYRLSMIVANDL